MYQAKKRLFGDLMNSDKVKYFNDKIVSCAGNQSTLFKTVDELLHRSITLSSQELGGRFSK